MAVSLERHQLVDVHRAELARPDPRRCGRGRRASRARPAPSGARSARRPSAGRVPRSTHVAVCRRSGARSPGGRATAPSARVTTRRSSTRDGARSTCTGDGLTWRSTRYTSNGSASRSRSYRCASTTWKMSPATMYSFATSTACWYEPAGHRRRAPRVAPRRLTVARRVCKPAAGRDRRPPARPARSPRRTPRRARRPQPERRHALDQVDTLAPMVERRERPDHRHHRVGVAADRPGARRAGARPRGSRRSRGSPSPRRTAG